MMRLVSTDLDSETGEPRLAKAGVQPEFPSMRILSPSKLHCIDF
jgi:hypothetical protein